jgi:hypothetical protein
MENKPIAFRLQVNFKNSDHAATLIASAETNPW